MTSEEAIKVLTEDTQHPTADFMPELLEAQKLGIEALRRHMAQECCLVNVIVGPLPGETKR